MQLKNDTPGLMLLIDFSKAFDSISHAYIESTMRAFNFCEEFIQHVATCLHHFKSRTLVNGCLSSVIELIRGCWQGDPVAAYLFILSLEILLRKIDKDGLTSWESKKGIKQLLEGYADDLTIVLKLLGSKEDKMQLCRVIEIL